MNVAAPEARFTMLHSYMARSFRQYPIASICGAWMAAVRNVTVKGAMHRSRAPAISAARHDAQPSEQRLRIPIEELSRRTNVTVRNLRELTTRGLLESPELEGRKGLYTQRHVARVTLVRTLQDRGYSLAAIADLLERWHGALGPLGVMGIEDDFATPGLSADRQLGEDELFALLPELRGNSRLRAQAEATGLVCKAATGTLFAPNAELVETVRALADVGIPLGVQLTDLGDLRAELSMMAHRFRVRFQEHVVAKLERRGLPADAIEELAARVASLRPAVVRNVAVALSSALERGGPLATAPARPRRAGKPRPASRPTRQRPRVRS